MLDSPACLVALARPHDAIRPVRAWVDVVNVALYRGVAGADT